MDSWLDQTWICEYLLDSSIFSRLDDYTLIKIFSFLSIDDITEIISEVCKRFRHLSMLNITKLTNQNANGRIVFQHRGLYYDINETLAHNSRTFRKSILLSRYNLSSLDMTHKRHPSMTATAVEALKRCPNLKVIKISALCSETERLMNAINVYGRSIRSLTFIDVEFASNSAIGILGSSVSSPSIG